MRLISNDPVSASLDEIEISCVLKVREDEAKNSEEDIRSNATTQRTTRTRSR
jgi:hypothetical protein